jgi:hypothetical protein
MMDGGSATAAAAAAGDVARVDAVEADATGPDASRADASSSETITTRSGPETERTAFEAVLLPGVHQIADEVCLSRKAQAEAAEDARLTKHISMCLDADGIIAQCLLSVSSGAGKIATVVLAILMALGCLAASIFLGRRRGPRQATDPESGGGGWLGLCRCWGGGTNGSRRMRFCIYYSTRGRHGSSRLGASVEEWPRCGARGGIEQSGRVSEDTRPEERRCSSLENCVRKCIIVRVNHRRERGSLKSPD